MNIITNDLIFNDRTLNIFTDASIIKTDTNETIGCAGNNIIVNNTILEQPTQIIRNSTNNNSEITAIYMAVVNALKYRDKFDIINIFSDSKICVFGLREWIYNWIKISPGDVLISSQEKPVANQEIILRIIYFILNHNLRINLYHVKGHVNYNSPDQLFTAKEIFMSSNHIKHDIDIELIRNICIANDQVDNFTREQLNNCIFDEVPVKRSFIGVKYTPFDSKRYANLLRV